MTKILLTTHIDAAIERCFDLSRDVGIHEMSAASTNEKAIAGRTGGLFELNDFVVWQASHFGITQRLKVKITKMEKPSFFEDTMVEGAFRSMRHEHHFSFENGKTKMTDVFEYEVPFWFFGRLFDRLVLK